MQTRQLSSISPTRLLSDYDWIIAKDVLEHIPDVRLTVKHLMQHADTGIFAVVPLSKENHAPYVIPDYEKDVTHCQRLDLATWAMMFMEPGWHVTAAYQMAWIKENWYRPEWDYGNGFIVARRYP